MQNDRNDVISRQAAIDALNEEYHGMISDESMKIYKIVEWLDGFPSAQQWIPCSERLPEEDKAVLVTTVWKGVTIAKRWRADKWLDGILAWMELPDPWEGENDGSE